MTEQCIYGIHAVTALFNNKRRKPTKLYLNQDREDKRLKTLQESALASKIPIEQLSLQKMNQRFADCPHQGVVALAGPLPEYQENDLPGLVEGLVNGLDDGLEKPALILILDGVTDPHNLGACLRTADAAGVDLVIIPKDKSASITAVVSKTASGATESVPLVRVTNLVRSMEMLKEQGIWIYGAALESSQNLYKLDLRGHVALVLGAEGQGLRRLARERCDGLFFLPMLGQVESLNVSVAAGISLYEVLRQRI